MSRTEHQWITSASGAIYCRECGMSLSDLEAHAAKLERRVAELEAALEGQPYPSTDNRSGDNPFPEDHYMHPLAEKQIQEKGKGND